MKIEVRPRIYSKLLRDMHQDDSVTSIARFLLKYYKARLGYDYIHFYTPRHYTLFQLKYAEYL